MTHGENLLVVAQEECAEIQEAISKALRFGVENHHPDMPPDITNGYNILREFHQLQAVMDMLVIQRIIPGIPKSEIHQIYRNKIENIEKWEAYSKSVGRVAENT